MPAQGTVYLFHYYGFLRFRALRTALLNEPFPRLHLLQLVSRTLGASHSVIQLRLGLTGGFLGIILTRLADDASRR